MRMKFRAILLSLLLSAPLAWADGLPDLGESSQADLPPHLERRIGETIVQNLRLRDPTYIDDVEVTAYLNQLGRRLAAQSADPGIAFEFFAVRDNTLNAFALPGGFIGAHSGLILAAQSESELAGVLAHEIAHVTQRHIARLVGKQSQAQIAQWLAIAVAILGSRSNSDISGAAMAAGAAIGIQTQLNYTREFEREADRIGFQVLEDAGYDVRATTAFFERIQKFGRLYENNAPDYLRTHPLTTERIADMENRAQQRPYRQVADSLEFQLVRAKLKTDMGTPLEAVNAHKLQIAEKKYASPAAAYYGLARAELRAGNPAAAQQALDELREMKIASPMLETLAGEIKQAGGDPGAALSIYRDAKVRYPRDKAVTYALIESLMATRQLEEALKIIGSELHMSPGDAPLYGLRAKTYAMMGKRLQQHRAQAELYALRGQLQAAIEQLEIAQRSKDGDFYELSAVDSRLRELRARHAEELKETQQR